MPCRMQALRDCMRHDRARSFGGGEQGRARRCQRPSICGSDALSGHLLFQVVLGAGVEAEVRPTRQRPRYCCVVICAAMTRHGMVMPRPSTLSRGMAQMTTPNQRARMSQRPVARASAAIACASAAPGSVLGSRSRTRATFSLPRRRLARC